MRATVAGVVQDLAPDLHVDRWIGKGEELTLVVADAGHQVRGYVREDLAARYSALARGQFIPDEPLTAKSDVRWLPSVQAVFHGWTCRIFPQPMAVRLPSTKTRTRERSRSKRNISSS